MSLLQDIDFKWDLQKDHLNADCWNVAQPRQPFINTHIRKRSFLFKIWYFHFNCIQLAEPKKLSGSGDAHPLTKP